MDYGAKIVDQVESLFKIISLIRFRRTNRVTFDMAPGSMFGNIGAIDKVIHAPGAHSPGAVNGVARPWYMHPHQEDNLMVISGCRTVELYTPKHGKIEKFEVYPDRIIRNGELVCECTTILNFPRGVFHRIISSEHDGSISLNFAIHDEKFDLDDNFNIYDLNQGTGEYILLRPGSEDHCFR
jgi:hypothetical protein